MGPPTAPAATRPRRLAFIETAGWPLASPGAKRAMEGVLERIANAGVELRTRANDPKVAAVEGAVVDARSRSNGINAWEGRWPLNTYRARDAAKLSDHALDRLKQAEAMTIEQYRDLIAERARARALYAELSPDMPATISLSAPGAAPVGLGWTGEPACTVHTSYLGTPSISLPLLRDEGLPLGLQVAGFEHRDADAFATAAWIEQTLK
jgi:Asp-tRNA(Asn)/Glu-tRNA(Gln) amidotransferase A subunit family amidase